MAGTLRTPPTSGRALGDLSTAVAPPSGALVGREEEQRRISELVAAACEGRGGALLVTGEPGIGKSALLAYTVNTATDAGVARVMSLAGVEAERDLPYAGLTQLIAPLHRQRDDLAPSHRAAVESVLGLREGAVPSRLALGMATLSLIAAATAEGPVLVAVDDLQWLDAASRDVVLFVARRLDAEPAAVLATVRDGTLGLDVLGGLDALALTGLGVEDAVAMLPAVRPHVVGELVDRTGGNPLALVEVAADLDDDEASGARALPDDLSRSRPEEMFAARVEGLDAAARHAARLVALAGAAPLSVLAAALDRTVPRTAGSPADDATVAPVVGVDLLAPAEECGLLRVADRVRWRHPLARAAAARGTSQQVRACHAVLADAWADVAPDAPAGTWHRAAAATGVDPDTAEALAQVASRAEAKGAAAEAADAWDRAAQLHPEAAVTAGWTAAAGRAAARAAQLPRAVALLRSAAQATQESPAEPNARDPRLGRLLFDMGCAELALGHGEEGRTAMRGVLKVCDDPGLCCRAAADLLAWSSWKETPTVAPPLFSRLTEIGAPASPAQEFLLAHMHAILDKAEGRFADAEVGAARAHDILAQHDVLAEDPSLLPVACRVNLEAGRATPVPPYVAAALERARGEADLIDLVPALMFAAQTTAMSGGEPPLEEWAEVEMLARFAGMSFLYTFAAQGLAEFDAHAGRLVECRARLRELNDWRVRYPPGWNEANLPWLEAYANMAEGNFSSAVGVLRPHMREASTSIAHNLPVYVALVADTQSVEAGRAELETLTAWRGTEHHRTAQQLVDPDPVAAQTAVDAYAAAGGPAWDVGFLQYTLARRWRATGNPEASQARLRASRERFLTAQATPWVARVDAELAGGAASSSAGGTPDAPASDRPHTGIASLTHAERRIADQVAQGRTNKEVAAALFVSPKTVEFHLSSAYRKLAVSNRTALARVLTAS